LRQSIDWLDEMPEGPSIPQRIPVSRYLNLDSIAMFAPLFISYYNAGEEKKASEILAMLSKLGLKMDQFFLMQVIKGCFNQDGMMNFFLSSR
jgi:hypothetical protein